MNTEQVTLESLTEIQEWDGVNLNTPGPGISIHTFSAGEAHLNLDAHAEVEGLSFVITVKGGSFAGLGYALVCSDALRRRGAREVSLFIPYLPAARQDKGIPFSAKVYADTINLGQFDRVISVDPHSSVMPALVQNFIAIDVLEAFPDKLLSPQLSSALMSRNVTIIAPDAGAKERAQSVAKSLDLPLIQAQKQRDPSTNFRVVEYSCAKPGTEFAFVIDDICDGGATFLALADAINMAPEKLFLWTTHGIYSKGTQALKQRYGGIFCTDSLPSSQSADVVSLLQPALIRVLSTT